MNNITNNVIEISIGRIRQFSTKGKVVLVVV